MIRRVRLYNLQFGGLTWIGRDSGMHSTFNNVCSGCDARLGGESVQIDARWNLIYSRISSSIILKRTDDTFWESDFPYYVGYLWWTVRAMLCWLFDLAKFRLLAVLERMHMPLQLFIGQVRGPIVTRFPIIKKDNQFTLHQMFLICEFQLNIKNTKNWKIMSNCILLRR